MIMCVQLSLQGCQGVSEEFLQLLQDRPQLLPKVKHLDMGWVNACSSSAALALSLRRPLMEVTEYYMQVFKGGEIVANNLMED
mmetsp:Transcript_17584/g.33154  ORF Transcript_17584/g.33154 Transcript_17584/m.33154 type:complete len:83 (+) Transcript_17584:1498-1746(+)